MQMVGHWTDEKQRQKVQRCINLDAALGWPLCTVTMLNWNPGCIFLGKFSPGDFTEWSGNEQKPFSWLLRPQNWAREVRVHYLSKGNIIVNYLSGKKRYIFNYLSLVHFFITWQRLGEVVRLPLQAPLVLCSLPPMNILYFCSWIIMLDERGSDFRLIQYDWPYKTRPNSAQKKLKIQEMVEIKRKGIY